MKKHLSLLFILLISACSGSGTSSLEQSSEPVLSISSSEISSSESLSSSCSSEQSSSESSSLSSSSQASSSSSAVSSSSSASSSYTAPTSKEVLDLFHAFLGEKQSVLEDPNYITQILYEDTILDNHYYGQFANQPDDGYMFIEDQGLFKYEKINYEIVIGDCKSIDPNTQICDYFMTSYDLKDLKKYWKVTENEYTYASKSEAIGEMVAELDGQGLLAYVAIDYENTLTIDPQTMTATYETILETDEYGSFNLSFTVRPLGSELPSDALNFLASHPEGLTSLNDFPSDIKEAIKNVTGQDIEGPKTASYAHQSYFTDTSVLYEDYLAGDVVDSYRNYILTLGYVLSDFTNEIGDLKDLGYIRYYYEKTSADLSSTVYIEIYFVPRVQLDDSVKDFYPNGIFHLRFVLN